jgi:galactokinase
MDGGLAGRIVSEFLRAFGEAPAWRAFAPGRVNLIGEHTDYNGGWVMPCAIDRSMVLAAGEAVGRTVLVSADRRERVEFDPDNLPPPRPGHWSSYLVGVMAEFRDSGRALPALRAVFGGDIPAGGGLSSSAALSNCMALLLDRVLGTRLPRERLARMSQVSEHRYAGVLCGIMDQYATLLGEEGAALLLDCRTGEYRSVPLRLDPYRLVLCNSMVKHDLSDGGYNARRRECEAALAVLRAKHPGLPDLRGATLEMLQGARAGLPPAEYRRVLHQVEENARVLEAEQALRVGDLGRLGSLMTDSHRSLRDNFEVTVPETDFLAGTALSLEGVLGARMTGGGFGGNVLALVREDRMESFAHDLAEAYRERFGVEADIFPCEPASGGAVEDLAVPASGAAAP